MTKKTWQQRQAERAERRKGLSPSGRRGTPSRLSRALQSGRIDWDHARRIMARRSGEPL